MNVKKLGLIALYFMPTAMITTSIVAMSNQPVYAQCVGSGPCNDVNLQAVCDSGECVNINQSYQSHDKVVFRFSGNNETNFFNIRYKTENGEKQVENRSGSFTLKNVKPNRVYAISVQGCVSHFLGRSTCSSWSRASVTTH